MMSSVIAARFEFNCGHTALVSLPRLKGERPAQRIERINLEKAGARMRVCDFCVPAEVAVVEVRPVQDAVLSGELNGHVGLNEEEKPMESAETPSVTRLGADEARRTFPPRRRLDDAQEREVTRLYAETGMPVPQISKQFSIGESSVYRIAQRHGAGLRGRVATPAPAASAPSAAPVATVTPAAPGGARRGRRPRAAVATAATPAPTPTRRRRTPAAVTRRAAVRAIATPTPTRRRAARTPLTAGATPTRTRRPRATVAAGALQRFEVHFRAEAVLQAADIQAALRQLESLGATDVQSIVRRDR